MVCYVWLIFDPYSRISRGPGKSINSQLVHHPDFFNAFGHHLGNKKRFFTHRQTSELRWRWPCKLATLSYKKLVPWCQPSTCSPLGCHHDHRIRDPMICITGKYKCPGVQEGCSGEFLKMAETQNLMEFHGIPWSFQYAPWRGWCV